MVRWTRESYLHSLLWTNLTLKGGCSSHGPLAWFESQKYSCPVSSLGKLLSRSLYKWKQITNMHWWSIYCRDKQSNLSGLCCRLFALLFSQVPESRGWKPSAQIWSWLPVLSSRKPNTQVSQSYSRNYTLYLQNYDRSFYFIFFLDLANVLRLGHFSLVLCSKRLGLFFCMSCLDVLKPSSTASSALRLQGLFPLFFHFLQVCVKGRKTLVECGNVEVKSRHPPSTAHSSQGSFTLAHALDENSCKLCAAVCWSAQLTAWLLWCLHTPQAEVCSVPLWPLLLCAFPLLLKPSNFLPPKSVKSKALD